MVYTAARLGNHMLMEHLVYAAHDALTFTKGLQKGWEILDHS